MSTSYCEEIAWFFTNDVIFNHMPYLPQCGDVVQPRYHLKAETDCKLTDIQFCIDNFLHKGIAQYFLNAMYQKLPFLLLSFLEKYWDTWGVTEIYFVVHGYSSDASHVEMITATLRTDSARAVITVEYWSGSSKFISSYLYLHTLIHSLLNKFHKDQCPIDIYKYV